MIYKIVADSSCDYFDKSYLSETLRYGRVPFTVTAGGKDFKDTEDIDIAEQLKYTEESPEAGKTACPAPGQWAEQFMEGDIIFALTVSGTISGSYSAAMAAREMILAEFPQKQIYVIDSKSAGPECDLIARKLAEMILDGMDAGEIAEEAARYAARIHVFFAFGSIDNLVKNGRVSRLVGFAARIMNMRVIGKGSDEGTFELLRKERGLERSLAALVEEMKTNGFDGGRVCILHCFAAESAENLKKRILDVWENAQVEIHPTGGLCSFYAERGGVILSF